MLGDTGLISGQRGGALLRRLRAAGVRLGLNGNATVNPQDTPRSRAGTNKPASSALSGGHQRYFFTNFTLVRITRVKNLPFGVFFYPCEYKFYPLARNFTLLQKNLVTKGKNIQKILPTGM